MDFVAEYDESRGLPIHIAITYKFFALFKVNTDANTMSWSKVYTMCAVPPEELRAFKEFLRSTRNLLKSEPFPTKEECSRRLWFFYQKLLEHAIFTTEIRSEILRWIEVCEYIVC